MEAMIILKQKYPIHLLGVIPKRSYQRDQCILLNLTSVFRVCIFTTSLQLLFFRSVVFFDASLFPCRNTERVGHLCIKINLKKTPAKYGRCDSAESNTDQRKTVIR